MVRATSVCCCPVVLYQLTGEKLAWCSDAIVAVSMLGGSLLVDRSVCSYASYLVDPASSHMLVSKTKPCKCKRTPLNGEAANGSL